MGRAVAGIEMRICIVGCGAVGSLFAANLGTLDDVEVWAYDLSRDHVEAINRDGLRLVGAGEVVGSVHATADAAELPPCDFGIVATKAMHTDRRVRRDRAARSRAAPSPRAERDRQRGGGRAALRAGDARHDLSGREGDRARASCSGTSRATRRSARSSLSRPRPPRSSGSPRPARAPACRPTRSPTRAARSGAR